MLSCFTGISRRKRLRKRLKEISENMILCIGEILADFIGKKNGEGINFGAFTGGAPFNVAVNAKQAGAKVGFIGRVGKDPIGKFVTEFAEKVGFDYLDIQKDMIRNTTLAFVTLTDGERDFAFFRHDTADFNIDAKEIDLKKYDGLNIVHLGSLMLSEEKGREFAYETVKKVRAANKILSFDVNLRMDLYNNTEQAITAYKPFIEEADVLKFSDDEIIAFTGKSDLNDAIKTLDKKERLLLITLGSRGSMYAYNGHSGVIPTVKVKPVDTTGAGDAFFGTFLACMDNNKWTRDNIESALVKANKAGADATQFLGAIKANNKNL